MVRMVHYLSEDNTYLKNMLRHESLAAVEARWFIKPDLAAAAGLTLCMIAFMVPTLLVLVAT